MCAVEFYRIHTKVVFAWKLGWVILTAEFLRFLVVGGSSALQVPETDHPWVASVTTAGEYARKNFVRVDRLESSECGNESHCSEVI